MTERFKGIFGRWTAGRTESGYQVYLEVTGNNQPQDIWIPLVDSQHKGGIGHIHLTSLGKGFFVLDGLRSAHCPMPIQSAECLEPLCLQQKGS